MEIDDGQEQYSWNDEADRRIKEDNKTTASAVRKRLIEARDRVAARAQEEFVDNFSNTQVTRLDPNDPIDQVLEKMVKTNRAKRRDYAADSDIFSNFRDVARMLGIPGVGAEEIAYILLLVKVARLRSLRVNGRMDDPSNESVLDTYLDLGVYSVIVQALRAESKLVNGKKPVNEDENDWRA